MSDVEDSNAPAPSRKIPVVPLIVILLLLGLAIFGQRGVLRALQLNRQKIVLEAQVKELEENNAALRQEIEALRSDARTIEAIARRELGMVKEDEVVYQFQPSSKEEGRPETAATRR
jgi:cell division protein FtsL